METILKTLANYYILFIFLALVGIFAIIGYFIEKKHPKETPEEPKLDMEAVAKKGGQGLGATLGQNPIFQDDEVEQLDMTMQPTTFVNSNSANSNLNTSTSSFSSNNQSTSNLENNSSINNNVENSYMAPQNNLNGLNPTNISNNSENISSINPVDSQNLNLQNNQNTMENANSNYTSNNTSFQSSNTFQNNASFQGNTSFQSNQTNQDINVNPSINTNSTEILTTGSSGPTNPSFKSPF